jgi:hypothetical protein
MAKTRTATAVSAIPVADAPQERIALPDGGSAELRGEALEVRDREGRLVVRYVDGAAEISAPAGDLRLSAPMGRVVIQSALDVEVEAGRDVVHRAGRRVDVAAATSDDAPQLRVEPRRVEVHTGEIDVQAQSSRAVIGKVAVIAHAIATTADRVAVTAADYEVAAERIVERARDSYREILGLAEERVGRVRALVRDVYALTSRRTVMTSSEETSIDGSRILLG